MVLPWAQKNSPLSNEIFDSFAFNGYSDAVISCGGKRIPVHKIVLSAASDFFKKILEESPDSHPVIVIQDTDVKDLETLLRFIYRGQVTLFGSDSPSLFKLAKDLRIKGLSGRRGKDYHTMHDSLSNGLQVLNLSMFRRYVKPCSAQSVFSLNFQINKIICAARICETQRANAGKVDSAAATGNRESVVKDFKFKSARGQMNRVKAYKVEKASSSRMKGAGGSKEDICNKLGNISLVKDNSEAFNDEEVQKLVTRLKTNLSLSEEKKEEVAEAEAESSPSLNEEWVSVAMDLSGARTSDQATLKMKASHLQKTSIALGRPMTQSDIIFSFMERFDYTSIVDKVSKGPDKTTSETPKASSIPTDNNNGEIVTKKEEDVEASPDETHRCPECPFQTKKMDDLLWHEKFHVFEMKKKLKQSKTSEDKAKEYSRRKPIDHAKATLRYLEKCSKLYAQVSGTDELIMGQFQCSECKQKFREKDDYETHLKSHKKSKKRRVGQRSSRHSRKKERTFICLFCNFKAYDTDGLNNHLKSHTTAKLYKCDRCPHRSYKPCEHFSGHEKVRKCTQCAFRCNNPKVLLLHVKKHEMDKESKQ